MDIEYRQFQFMTLSKRSRIKEMTKLWRNFIVCIEGTSSGGDLEEQYLREVNRLITEAVNSCRFDVAYLVSVVQPRDDLRWPFRELLETRNRALGWRRDQNNQILTVTAMTDASYRSLGLHTGQVFAVNNNAVMAFSEASDEECWGSCRAELIAIMQFEDQLQSIGRILDDLDFKWEEEILTDSLGSIGLLKSDHAVPLRAQHIRARYLTGDLGLGHIYSRENFADLLTKHIFEIDRRALLLERYFDV
ncbi:LAME_0C04280g1_1 [Lachancea meyersii CBS 8951]|uniref:LAME_0C04280g1_1 n=1 Tax=Lachancea meyersii CBS 8951 TaxID=1266667 RepID=A0A1G4J1D3_9SACH|nr:LAME_0C04280g1_1 [Lachancea meyersii CBS 8951]